MGQGRKKRGRTGGEREEEKEWGEGRQEEKKKKGWKERERRRKEAWRRKEGLRRMLFQPSPRRRHGPFVTYVGKEVMASQRRPTPATRVAAASTLKAGDPCPGPSSPSSPQRFPHASKFPLYFLICLLTKPYRLNPLLYPPLSFFLCRFFVSFFIYSFRLSTSKSWKMYKSRPVHTFFISSSWIWGGPNDRHINPLWLFSSRSSRCQTHWASLRRYESAKKIRLDNDKGIYTSIAYGLW